MDAPVAPALFLSPAELEQLTGRKRVRHQIEALRAMGVAFRVNAAGRPVVTRAAIEHGHAAPAAPTTWQPRTIARSA